MLAIIFCREYLQGVHRGCKGLSPQQHTQHGLLLQVIKTAISNAAQLL